MKKLLSDLAIVFIVGIMISCGDSGSTITPIVSTDCTVTEETTSLVGNQTTWTYAFDGSNNMNAITRKNQVGNVTNNVVVSGTRITSTSVVVSAGADPVIEQYDFDQNIFTGLPAVCNVSLSLDGEPMKAYRTFKFTYDAKSRVTTISESTPTYTNDLEFDVVVTYNDSDNVTKLEYQITDGPDKGKPGNVITVAANDDKPTPYAGTKGWKYIMANFTWDNYDPEPVITALSKNNPLDYAFAAGTASELLRTMSYEYNDDGFPTKRINKNKNNGGEYTFEQTFTYSCK